MNWRDDARCREVDPELFFPVVRGPMLVRQEAEAKAVCAKCTACTECLRWAVSHLPIGIAGGLTEYERIALRSKQEAS
jgi:WhiB family redox-sensing transcriptional regulator